MANIYDMVDTWNDAGTTFTAIKMNVTDTASAAASLLMDLQVGGSSKFKVDKDGKAVTAALGASTVAFGDGTTGLGLTSGIVRLIAAGNLGLNVTSSYTQVVSGLVYIGSDVLLYRDAANTLAQRNGTAAQASRLYFSYTDASNYTRLALKTATGVHTIETESAGTGEANIDLALTPKGTGNVRFGTHAAIGAETVTGYITIKDAGGVARKIAVVS